MLEFLCSCCAYRISQVVSNCDHCMGYCRKEMCCVEKRLLDVWGVPTVGSCYFTSVNNESITYVRWGWKTWDKEESWWWIKIMFTPCGLINGQCTTKMHTLSLALLNVFQVANLYLCWHTQYCTHFKIVFSVKQSSVHRPKSTGLLQANDWTDLRCDHM